MKEGCACSNHEEVGVFYIGGRRTGIIGFERLLEEWKEAKKTPEGLSDAIILRDLRRRNYIPGPAEPEYAEAARQKYREFSMENDSE